MDIESKVFDTQEIAQDAIIHFPDGIPGFDDQRQFQLFQQEDSNIVYLLQSLSNSEIAFSVTHPSHFNIHYNFVLTSAEEERLEIQSVEDLLILLILHRDENPDEYSQPTIKGSIKSPLLINTKKRIGIQKTLHSIEQSITLTETNNEIEVHEI